MDLHPKQFVRVHVGTIKGEEGVERIVDRHFSVDPRTITLDRLRHLVARALDVRGEFSLLCLRSGEAAVPLSCDWDLEGALSEEPRIDLALELQPQEPGLEEWDVICPADVPVAGHEASGTPPHARKGSFLEQVLRLCNPLPANKDGLSESQFSSLADWPCPLRYAVYRAGGAEPGVRPALWMHLLDVYPTGAGRHEREDFLNRKAEEYYGLRHDWQKLLRAGDSGVPEVLRDVTCLVRKDVRRTDRLLELDERALYNVLTTYAVHHPSVGYRQGMSDLLSPLLHVMGTEARAYVAFCGLMRRMRDNFRPDGRSVRTKFRHLRRALRTHDPALHEHLQRCGALDLLFCYRWLLLDLKREFPYREMLNLAEVLWSTLRPARREKGVELYEVRFRTTEDDENSTSRCEESGPRCRSSVGRNPESEDCSSSSTDDERDEKIVRHRRRTRVDEWLRHSGGDSNYGSTLSEDDEREEEEEDWPSSARSRSEGYDSEWSSEDEDDDSFAHDRFRPLPGPTRLGDGKPFLIFLCLTLLTGQREVILGRCMDAAEIAVHFDRLVRRHRLADVLPVARQRFEDYLRTGWTEDDD